MDEKRAYIDKARAEAAACEAEVDELAARTDEVSERSREHYEKQIADLRRKCSTLSDRLADLEWGSEAWDDAKQAANKALATLKDSIERVRSRLG